LQRLRCVARPPRAIENSQEVAAPVFAETSQPMSELFGGASYWIVGDITH
jgi:hypothetical protein